MSNLNEKTGVVDIQSVNTTISHPSMPADFDAQEWLSRQNMSEAVLLAHTYDGVIWGYRDDTGWHLSSDAAPDISPALDTHLLLEMRLFNANEELSLWRDDTQFRSRHLIDAPGPSQIYYDEPYVLWGTQGTALPDGFTLMEDGSQGLAHAIPVGLNDFNTQNVRPITVQVRHYIERDTDTGLARVTRSRLVRLSVNAEVKNGSKTQ